MSQPRSDPKVTIRPPAELFAGDAQSFTIRKDDQAPPEAQLPQAKDWKQIAFDFLSRPGDMHPLDDYQTFAMIDTTRAGEFAAGRGAHTWNELRPGALADSKEKRRRARK
jgi:hypothetical protein